MSSFIGYESPITRIMRDIQTQIIKESENQIFQAVQKCEIKVDKEELIKALQYDRGQYEKGYKEGAIVELENIRHKIAEEIYNTNGYVTYGNALNYCYCLVDERIDKLKGENKNDLP